MEEIVVNSLREFEDKVDEFRPHQPKWRGHQNADWILQTTLERFLQMEDLPESESYPFQRYFGNLQQVAHFLGNSSGLELSFYKELGDHGIDVLNFWEAQEHWEDLVQLRHHNFPSFFLDWTQSPWIALYFAFESANRDDRAVYVNLPGKAAAVVGGSSFRVVNKGFYAKTPRHRKQQCFLACAFEDKGPADKRLQPKAVYNEGAVSQVVRRIDHIVPFEKAIKETQREESYKKLVLPAGLRKEVLYKLAEHNISHFTLFGNAEAAIRTATLNSFVINYFTH